MDINNQVYTGIQVCLLVRFLQGFYLSFILVLAFWGVYTILRYQGLLPEKNLTDQHIFITGGSSGIGKELGKQLLQLGAKVTLSGINVQEGGKAKKEFNKLGFKNVEYFSCDVTDQQMVKEVDKQGEIDIFINNAGIANVGLISQKDVELSKQVYDVNLISHLYTVKEVINSMINRNKGHIVTIASGASYVRVLYAVDYHVSKKAAIGFHEGLVQEFKFLEKDVKATCLCPAFVSTNMTKGLIPENKMMSVETCVKRMVLAIQQEENVVIQPFWMNILVTTHAALPYSVYYAIIAQYQKYSQEAAKILKNK